jgi:hypothetical protein
MVRAGWADIWFLSDFQRSSVYLPAAAEAEWFRRGVWGLCDGDFHFNRAKELRQRRQSAVAFMRRYYRRLSNRQFAAAWGMLARRVRRKLRPVRYLEGGLSPVAAHGRVVRTSTPVRQTSRRKRPAASP